MSKYKIKVHNPLLSVPTSFIDSYSPDYFEIVGTVSAPNNPNSLNLGIDYSNYVGVTQDGILTGRTGSTFGKNPVLVMNDKKHVCYVNNNNVCVQIVFPRIFIKRKSVTDCD